MYYLRSQLKYYQIDVIHHKSFQNISTISELYREWAETNKSQHYHLIDKLIRFILTLSVSTATTEQTLSAMKYVKIMLRNKMEDEFLEDSMMIYIIRELVEDIDSDPIIDELYYTKHIQRWTLILYFIFIFIFIFMYFKFYFLYILCYVFGLKLYY